MAPLQYCTTGNNWIVLPNTHLAKDEIYSMLLSAVMSDRQLVIRIDDATTNCSIMFTTVFK